MTLLVACGLTREAGIIARLGAVAVAGGGDAARLEALLEAGIAAGGVTALLSSGIAGALDPALKSGNVVIGTLACDLLPGEGRGPATERTPTEDNAPSKQPSQLDPGLRRGSALLAMLRDSLPQGHQGTIAGSDTIAATLAQKRALRASTGAIAVDMESHIAARVAERHALPFAILRTISDAADHVLPPAALVGMTPDGGMALGAVLVSLARNPAQLPALIRTGRDAGRAFSALEGAFRQLTLADCNALP